VLRLARRMTKQRARVLLRAWPFICASIAKTNGKRRPLAATPTPVRTGTLSKHSFAPLLEILAPRFQSFDIGTQFSLSGNKGWDLQ